MNDVAKALESALEKAKAALKNPDKKTNKAKGKVRSIAERLLSIGNMLDESGKPPDARTMRQLRGLMNEIGAAIDRYPSPKRAVKSQTLDAGEFLELVTTEIQKGVSDNDLERLEQAEANIVSVTNQVADVDEIGKVHIDVFTDTQKGMDTNDIAASSFTALAESLTGLVDSIKAKNPKDEKEEEGTSKQEIKCPACGAMNPAGSTKCNACGAEITKANPEDEKDKDKDKVDNADKETDDKHDKTEKANVIWPADMNEGRKLNEAESWGRIKKSVEGDDRSFGPDPE